MIYYFSCWYDYDLIIRDTQQRKMFVQSEITRSKHVYWLIAYVTISTSTFQNYFWVTIDYMLWGVVVNFTIFRIVLTASFCIPTKNGIPTIIWIYPVFSKFTDSPVSDIGMDRTVRVRDESAQGDKCPKLSSKKKALWFQRILLYCTIYFCLPCYKFIFFQICLSKRRGSCTLSDLNLAAEP